ncbi:hypothetical protein [Spiroplasma endosymbiont of Glossina fuscipes fuscipes]|uniref:hypothetical protein n=1 Tax=Spiroplasma endosymbiont of Glossina fuscipes fuscipes TaxID=2004463 RepID=UPI003C78807C
MLNKNQLLQHYQQDYDLVNKIKGWCVQAQQGKIVATDFLDLRQLAILTAILRQEKITDYTIHAPFVNGFRKTVSFNSTEDNTIVLAAPQPTPMILQHHVLLGFILNQLQLDLRVIGDLYVTPTMIYLSVLTKIAPVFTDTSIVIQKHVLTWQEVAAPVVLDHQFTIFTKTVKSLRLDAVVSAICNLSRQKAQAYVQADNVYVNFSVVNNKTFQVACDIIISIRRYGRFKINEIIPSKNQHYRITIAKFA